METWAIVSILAVLNTLVFFIPDDLQRLWTALWGGILEVGSIVIVIHFAVKWW